MMFTLTVGRTQMIVKGTESSEEIGSRALDAALRTHLTHAHAYAHTPTHAHMRTPTHINACMHTLKPPSFYVVHALMFNH